LLQNSCGTTDPLDLLLRGGKVRRYHQWPTFHQDVAQHTWRVMVILMHLWPETPPGALLTALYHDTSEALTGDLPAPVKRDPALRAAVRNLEAEFMDFVGVPNDEGSDAYALDYNRRKCADYIELCFTALETQPGSERDHVLRLGRRFVYEAAARLGGEDEKKIVNFMLERFPDA
jgi:5'-deoxynucleotidase YfbR-like HD superfamily hydrolase